MKITDRTSHLLLITRLFGNEIWCRWEALFSLFPGRIGRLIRHLAISPFFAKCKGIMHISEHEHIWNPRNLRCGEHARFRQFSQRNAEGGISTDNQVTMEPCVMLTTVNHRLDKTECSMITQPPETKPILLEDDIWIGEQYLQFTIIAA